MSEGDRSAEGEGSVAAGQGTEKTKKEAGWRSGGVRVFFQTIEIPTPPPLLKIKLSPFKPSSPNVPDEKWPNTLLLPIM